MMAAYSSGMTFSRHKHLAARLTELNFKGEMSNKSPNASKHARFTRSTGKSLRASPALYAWRWPIEDQK